MCERRTGYERHGFYVGSCCRWPWRLRARLSFRSGFRRRPRRTQKKFDEYRAAIKKAHGIDIRNYKQKLKGGRADGKQVTDFDLDQLIMGIKVEQEHTTDKYTALEITMDHLAEFPDYYTRSARNGGDGRTGGCRRGEKERAASAQALRDRSPQAKKEGPSG